MNSPLSVNVFLCPGLHCWMLPVISGGSKEVPFASWVFLHLRLLVGELETLKVAQISPRGNACIYTVLLHGVSDLDQRRLETLHSDEVFAFWGVNNVPLNFESRNPQKTEILVPWIGLSSVNDEKSNTYNFNMPIMTKFLRGIAPMNGRSWAVPRLTQQIQHGGRRPYWIS